MKKNMLLLFLFITVRILPFEATTFKSIDTVKLFLKEWLQYIKDDPDLDPQKQETMSKMTLGITAVVAVITISGILFFVLKRRTVKKRDTDTLKNEVSPFRQLKKQSSFAMQDVQEWQHKKRNGKKVRFNDSIKIMNT